MYFYYDPSIANSGMKDTAWSDENILYAQEGDKTSALAIGTPRFEGEKLITSNGFYGINDGLNQLRLTGKLETLYARAENGNVTQIAEVASQLFARKSSGTIKLLKGTNTLYETTSIELVLSFGKNPKESLENARKTTEKGFTKCLAEYEKGWSDYVKDLPKD